MFPPTEWSDHLESSTLPENIGISSVSWILGGTTSTLAPPNGLDDQLCTYNAYFRDMEDSGQLFSVHTYVSLHHCIHLRIAHGLTVLLQPS